MIAKHFKTWIHIPSRRVCDVFINEHGELHELQFRDDKKVHKISKEGLYCVKNLQSLPYVCDF